MKPNKESEKLKLALGIISGRIAITSLSKEDYALLGLLPYQITDIRVNAENIVYGMIEALL